MKVSFKSKVLAAMLALLTAAMTFLTACEPSRSVFGSSKLSKSYFEQNKSEVLAASFKTEEIAGDFQFPFSSLFNGSESFYISLGLDLAFLSQIPEYEGGSIDISFGSDTKKFENMLGLQIISPELQLIPDMDYTLYLDKNKIVFSSDSLFGEGKSYGLKFDNIRKLAEKFDNSELAKVLQLPEGTLVSLLDQYGMDENYFNNCFSELKKYEENSEKTVSEFFAEINSVLEKYYGDVTETTVEDRSGNNVEVLALDMQLSPILLTDMLNSYKNYFKNYSADQKEFISAVIPDSLKELGDEYTQSFDSSYESAFAEIDNMINNFTSNVNLTGSIVFNLDKNNGNIIRADLSAIINSAYDTITVSASEFFDNGIYFESAAALSSGESFGFDGSLAFTENSAVLTMNTSENGTVSDSVTITFESDKNAGTYRVFGKSTASEGTTELFELSGRLSYDDKNLDFSIDSITDSWGNQSDIGISVSFSTDWKTDAPSDFIDILEMTEDEAYALIGKIVSFSASSLMY